MLKTQHTVKNPTNPRTLYVTLGTMPEPLATEGVQSLCKVVTDYVFLLMAFMVLFIFI